MQPRTPNQHIRLPRGRSPSATPGVQVTGLSLRKRELMQQEIEEFNQQYGRKLVKTREYIKDTCSLFAVVTIFLASLAAALLSYMNDTFLARPDSKTKKITDDLVVLFLFLAIVTAVTSTTFLLIGAIYAIFGPEKKRRAKPNIIIFAIFSIVKLLVFPLARFLRRGVHRDEVGEDEVGQTLKTDRRVDLIDYAAGRALRFMATALLFAAFSVLTFFIALGIYIWVDHALYISTIISFVTFIIPPLFFFSVF